MIKAIFAAAAITLISAPAPASQDQKNGAKTQVTSEQLYCFRFDRDTGSRINREECRTKKQWSQKGVDVDDVLKK